MGLRPRQASPGITSVRPRRLGRRHRPLSAPAVRRRLARTTRPRSTLCPTRRRPASSIGTSSRPRSAEVATPKRPVRLTARAFAGAALPTRAASRSLTAMVLAGTTPQVMSLRFLTNRRGPTSRASPCLLRFPPCMRASAITETPTTLTDPFDPPLSHDLYKWAQTHGPASLRKTRSASFSHPSRNGEEASSSTYQQIKEPGGFRRNYIHARAQERGEESPRVLRNVVDFLYLFGSFVSLSSCRSRPPPSR